MPVALSCILRILYLERLKEQREHDDRVGYRDVHPISGCTFGSVIASSRVPRSAGFAGLPPAAGLSRAADWPLVQIPTDRHTTTGHAYYTYKSTDNCGLSVTFHTSTKDGANIMISARRSRAIAMDAQDPLVFVTRAFYMSVPNHGAARCLRISRSLGKL